MIRVLIWLTRPFLSAQCGEGEKGPFLSAPLTTRLTVILQVVHILEISYLDLHREYQYILFVTPYNTMSLGTPSIYYGTIEHGCDIKLY